MNTDDLRDLHEQVLQADVHARRVRAARDRCIRQLVSDGTTAYRIAQTIGISQTAVAKILKG